MALTLLENLIAFTILLLGVLAVASVTPMLLRGQRLSDDSVLGSQLAQYFLEQELANTYAYDMTTFFLGYPACSSTNTTVWTAIVPATISSPSPNTVVPGAPVLPQYWYKITRSAVNTGYSSQALVQVTVQVMWPESTGAAVSGFAGKWSSFTLVGYLTPPPWSI